MQILTKILTTIPIFAWIFDNISLQKRAYFAALKKDPFQFDKFLGENPMPNIVTGDRMLNDEETIETPQQIMGNYAQYDAKFRRRVLNANGLTFLFKKLLRKFWYYFEAGEMFSVKMVLEISNCTNRLIRKNIFVTKNCTKICAQIDLS